jgi:DinB superfamily
MTSTSPTLPENSLTTEEIIRAARHLSIARGYLLDTVYGLSASQWNFRPDNDSWSIADNVEHLVLIEGRVHAIIGNMINAAEAEPGHKESVMDDFIISEVPKRSFKVKASSISVCPANRWTGPQALESFIAGREQTMQLLAAPLLRGRVMPRPLFGPWDGYQWLLAVASHSIRRTSQIREVKAHADFPQA